MSSADALAAPDGSRRPRRPIRVLKVIPGLNGGGGAERSLLSTAPGLVRCGIRLHVAVMSDRQRLVPDLEAAGVVIHDLSNRHGFVATVRALRRLLRDVEPDVLHATLFEASAPSQVASVGSGVPVLVTWAATTYTEDHLAEPGAKRLKLRGYQLLEVVLGRASSTWYHAVTPAVARLNAASLRVDPGRVLVGERGRDAALFPPWKGPVDDGSRPVTVLAVGRQDPQKGYETLLDAFDELAERDERVQLRIAGREGLATPSLTARHRRLRHAERVEFMGARDDVPGLLADSSVVVCTSRREGAAGALIEAMAAGVPIVSVPVAGLDGILLDGVNSLVVPRDQLADGLERVLRDPALARTLAEGGRRTYEQRFTIEAATAQMAEVYRTVAAAGGSRG